MLPVLRAERQEAAVAASAFPHLADADRRGVLRDLRSRANPAVEKPQPRSLHEALMGVAGIDRVIVPAARGTAGDAAKPRGETTEAG